MDKKWVIDYDNFFKALDEVAGNNGTYDDLTKAVQKYTASNPKNSGMDAEEHCTKEKVYAKLAYVRNKWNLTITLKKATSSTSESELNKYADWKERLLKHESIKHKKKK